MTEEKKTKVVCVSGVGILGLCGKSILSNYEVIEINRGETIEPFEMNVRSHRSKDIRQPGKQFKSVKLPQQRIKRGRR